MPYDAEHAKTPWVLPDTITRYDGDIEMGQPGWCTEVTRDQMLVEILYAMANADTTLGEIGCTVNYSPGETEREYQEELRRATELTGSVTIFSRRTGRHHVSLWRTEWDENDTRRNHVYATFMFGTEPDVMFWNGI